MILVVERALAVGFLMEWKVEKDSIHLTCASFRSLIGIPIVLVIFSLTGI